MDRWTKERLACRAREKALDAGIDDKRGELSYAIDHLWSLQCQLESMEADRESVLKAIDKLRLEIDDKPLKRLCDGK